jgi:putative hemolysin
MATKENISTMKSENTDAPIQIDLGAVLASRGVRLPAWLVRRLEKLICQDQLNAMLAEAYPRRGAAFCRAVLDHLAVNVDVHHPNLLPESPRAIFVCNHPLGGLDGMALIDFITAHYGCQPKFVVNDLLMAIEPLSEVFLPINKHGAQSRESLEAIEAALDSDVPVIIFPAGLCSRRRAGKVADLEWHKMFVQRSRQSNRPIVPLHFFGQNSTKFYRLARLREQLGVKLNVEMALLPGEIFKARGASFAIACGAPIAQESLSPDFKAEARRIRSLVYSLK